MKIEKRPSGSYRVRFQENGHRVTVTFDHRPTQNEIRDKIAEKLRQVPCGANPTTFYAAALSYTDMKRNILSPRTIREYSLYPDRLPKWFVDTQLHMISQAEVQRCVNELAKTRAPSTVHTLHGFIASVLGVFRPELKISTTLPQKVRSEPYIPTDEDVRQIVAHCKANAPYYYVPIMLACYGLRRSEILGIRASDLEGNMLTIRRAVVEDEDGEWVEKLPKTVNSTRTIAIPSDVARIIRKQGYAYQGGPQCISNYLRRTQDKLGMEHFSIHKLRHYFASKLSSAGVPEADILELGGWSTDSVMKSVYRHAMNSKSEEGKKAISDLLSGTISRTKT